MSGSKENKHKLFHCVLFGGRPSAAVLESLERGKKKSQNLINRRNIFFRAEMAEVECEEM